MGDEIVNVIVYPAGGDPEETASYFSDPRFRVLEYEALVGTEDPKLNEFLWMQGALKYSQEKNPRRSCIIVKDTSHTNFPSRRIAEICINALTVAELDMFYLTKWDDMCNLYRTASEDTFWTLFPRGNQCILYTPRGIQIVTDQVRMPDGNLFGCKDMWMEECLNKEISAGNLRATSLFGNLLDYNAIRYGPTNLSFNKLNECVNYTSASSESTPNIYLFVIGIIVLILLIAWGLYRIGPKEVSPSDVARRDLEIEREEKAISTGG